MRRRDRDGYLALPAGGQHRLGAAVPKLPPPGMVQMAPGARALGEGALPLCGAVGTVAAVLAADMARLRVAKVRPCGNRVLIAANSKGVPSLRGAVGGVRDPGQATSDAEHKVRG